MADVVDMASFTEAKSDQITADDLIGQSRTITVTRVTGSDGDQPVAIHYEGDNGKPFKPCKTIRRVLMAVWGRYANEYVGKSMTLYRDDKVQFGGLEVGGIRISHMSHIDKDTTVVVMKSKGKKAGMKILPLRVEQRQEQPREQRQRQSPESWVDQYVEQVAAAQDKAALEDLRARGKNALTKLATEHPALHSRAVNAYGRRLEQLDPPDDDPLGEGRTDADHGDQHDGADEPDHAARALEIAAEITAAESVDAIGAIERRTRAEVLAMPEQIQQTVWDAKVAQVAVLEREAGRRAS